MEILHIEDLTFKYPGAEENAVNSISFDVRQGEFVLLCGVSGCGKTTLLKLLKPELSPHGERRGSILYDGVEIRELDNRRSAGEIGFVMQSPDSQIVTDKVWHELAFGLENLGVPSSVIRRRVGEIACYFGIQNILHEKTDELSGGQKQLLNLASVMVMQPKLLILDEPTGQLDPIAASEFIGTLVKLNRELGLTIILAEHRLEEVFPAADRVLVMDKGSVLMYDTPKHIGANLDRIEALPIYRGLPSAMRLYRELKVSGECPLTVREGRDMLEADFAPQNMDTPPECSCDGKAAVELRRVWFRYERNSPDVLRGISLSVTAGEHMCILGGNGAGKTTMLRVMAGLLKAYRGGVFINERKLSEYRSGSLYRNCLALLPQDPVTLFIKDNVRDDLTHLVAAHGKSKEESAAAAETISEMLGITHLLDRHPYDLSGGEQQKCALAKLLMTEPRIILLDEPTKGLDAASKTELRRILDMLKTNGTTIITVTHDVEFAAETADRCALFFDGEIVSVDTPARFFAENNYYTTAASRMARGLFRYAVTCRDVVLCCGGCE